MYDLIEYLFIGALILVPIVLLFTIIDKLEIKSDKKQYEKYLIEQAKKEQEKKTKEG